MNQNLISATNGGGVLILEAWSAIAGAAGPLVDVLKVIMILVIVATSTIGALGADHDGDGEADIFAAWRRLTRRKKGGDDDAA